MATWVHVDHKAQGKYLLGFSGDQSDRRVRLLIKQSGSRASARKRDWMASANLKLRVSARDSSKAAQVSQFVIGDGYRVERLG